MDLIAVNKELKEKTPQEIIQWALAHARQAVLTTNFRPLDQSIIHAVVSVDKTIPVVWIDSGYNTFYTYQHALRTIERFALNLDVFIPQQTAAFRDVVMGIPEPDTKEHDEFTYQVKLEPFNRAMAKYQPDVWFANLRKDQTDFRNNLDIVTETKDGVLRVCPFFFWTEEDVKAYMEAHQLESEERYYDPTKVLANRECGLHT